MINRLNLLWRVIGGNIILIIIGIILSKSNNQNAQYLLTTNIITSIFVTLQIITRKLSIVSDIKDILTVYVVCLTVVNYCNIETAYHCLMSTLCAMVNAIWIIKFVMIKKQKIMNKNCPK